MLEDLKKQMEELKEKMNDTQKDFISYGYDLIYIDSNMMEYADQNVSIYSIDNIEYYEKDPSRASELLKDYGYGLNQFDTLDKAIEKAGQILELEDIMDELREDNLLEEYKDLKDQIEQEGGDVE